MAEKLSKPKSQQILGVASGNLSSGQMKPDEFLPELKGTRAIKKYREMRENDSTIGAVMYAVEQILRDVDITVRPVDESEEAAKEAEFVQSVLDDMDHTLDDHVSESLSYLSYGFAWFEIVYKRRDGPKKRNPSRKSKYSDGRMGIRKIASRAPWTISKFEVDRKTGEVEGIKQNVGWAVKAQELIPTNKSLYYKTPTVNNDPSGRSILRNAYVSYTYLNRMQNIEAIAIERELNGIPVGRIPSDYLSSTATDDQKAVVETFERVLRDTKFNDQNYVLLPSDNYPDKEGAPSGHRLMDFELMSSSGSRNIDVGPVISRYQHDIARSILSEFLMLGSSSTGSYALSKSKTDLFLRALESYIQTIVDVLNKQLVERLWEINGLNYDLMPKVVAGDVAPHDLKELGSYLRNLNGADINLSDQVDIIDALLDNAELPTLDREQYTKSQEDKKEADKAKLMSKEEPSETPDSKDTDKEDK
jgi:hypothetical protein